MLSEIEDLNYKGFEFNHKRPEILQDIIDRIPEDKKIIIWCKYEHDMHQITETLGQNNVAQFYGKINPKNREKSINEFRNGKRFFLATESCGGHGLTLNEAHYVIFYNNGFKYSERMQAEDRCHRIGQECPVTYVDIVCEDSIDERIMDSMYNKGSVVESFKQEVDAVKDKNNDLKELIRKL